MGTRFGLSSRRRIVCMLIGLCRPKESRTVDVEGGGMAEVSAAVDAEVSEGWEVASMPALPRKGGGLTTSAVLVRRDGLVEVEGADFDAVRAAVPEGYELLTVRRA